MEVAEKQLCNVFPSSLLWLLAINEFMTLARQEVKCKTDTSSSSVEREGLLAGVGFLLGVNLDNVEADGLGKRSALANGHDVTLLNTGESGRAVSGDVLVSLLESVVLLDVMKVVSSDNDGSLHLGRNNDSPIHIIIINIYKIGGLTLIS